MDRRQFHDLLTGASPPGELSLPLQGLWFAAKGNWTRAHESVQEDSSWESAWVHAYLHRLEGDLGNAGYWYRKAGQAVPKCSLEAEWQAILEALLPAPPAAL